ncbi:Protein doublesex, partial [Frankliniella fusca]
PPPPQPQRLHCCRACRGHGIQATGSPQHSKTCPFVHCSCDWCDSVRITRTREKELLAIRKAKAADNPSAPGASSTSTPSSDGHCRYQAPGPRAEQPNRGAGAPSLASPAVWVRWDHDGRQPENQREPSFTLTSTRTDHVEDGAAHSTNELGALAWELFEITLEGEDGPLDGWRHPSEEHSIVLQAPEVEQQTYPHLHHNVVVHPHVSDPATEARACARGAGASAAPAVAGKAFPPALDALLDGPDVSNAEPVAVDARDDLEVSVVLDASRSAVAAAGTPAMPPHDPDVSDGNPVFEGAACEALYDPDVTVVFDASCSPTVAVAAASTPCPGAPGSLCDGDRSDGADATTSGVLHGGNVVFDAGSDTGYDASAAVATANATTTAASDAPVGPDDVSAVTDADGAPPSDSGGCTSPTELFLCCPAQPSCPALFASGRELQDHVDTQHMQLLTLERLEHLFRLIRSVPAASASGDQPDDKTDIVLIK